MLNLLQTGQKSLHNIWMLGDSARALTRRLTASGLVTDRPCLLLECGGSYVTESEYVSPTNDNSPGSGWILSYKVWDDNLSTFSSGQALSQSWSAKLELWLSEDILCSGVRFEAEYLSGRQNSYQADYWSGSAWIQFGTGIYQGNVWFEKDLPSLLLISKVRLGFYNPDVSTRTHYWTEFDFIRRKVLDVTIYDGFNNTGKAKHRIVLSSTGSDFKRFKQPVYFAHGLYAEFAESVGECFIRYKEVGR